MGNGDLGPPRPDQFYAPPTGGQAVAGQRSNIRAKQVIIVGGNPPASGLYVYNPAQAAGDLIASIAANSGHDTPGNAVIQGIANYVNNGVAYQSVVLQNGQLVFYAAPTEAGPWTVQAVINCGGSGNPLSIQAAGPIASQGVAIAANPSGQIALQSPFFGSTGELSAAGTGTTPLLVLDNTASNLGASESLAFIAANVGDRVEGFQVTGDTFDRFSIAADGTTTWGPGNAAAVTSLSPVTGAGLQLLINHNNVNALTIQNIQANGGQSLVQLTTSVNTDRALGIQAAADTSERVRIDAVPQLLFGPGNVAGDCLFGRAGPGEFYSDGIAAKISNAPEVWNAIGAAGNPAFANGWTNSGGVGQAVLQFRKVAAPYNCTQWIGIIVAPAGIVAGQTITGATSGAYKPNNQQSIAARNITSGATAWLSNNTGGALAYRTGAIAGDVLEITCGNGMVSLDA